MARTSQQKQAAPGARRRRIESSDQLVKMTFQFHASVAAAIRAVVQSGEAPSANVFVEQAVRERLRDQRREHVYAEYARAAKDPGFVAEMLDTDRAFDVAIGDGARGV